MKLGWNAYLLSLALIINIGLTLGSRDSDGSHSVRDHEEETKSNTAHSRKKRLIWVTDDGRLALPPGTSMTIAPTIAMPLVRYPPRGFLSNISISLPITIDFDKLGLTDNQNPLGVLPPIFARSMGRAAGSALADYVSDFLKTRKKRSANFANDYFKVTDAEESKLSDVHKNAFLGGERAFLFIVVEDFISNFGLNGKACLLRAICEVHSRSMQSLGLLGEFVRLFFTASLSPYSEHLEEYVLAENIGNGKQSPGECFPYYKECPKSLFRMSNAYHENMSEHHEENESSTSRPHDMDSIKENIIELKTNDILM